MLTKAFFHVCYTQYANPQHKLKLSSSQTASSILALLSARNQIRLGFLFLANLLFLDWSFFASFP